MASYSGDEQPSALFGFSSFLTSLLPSARAEEANQPAGSEEEGKEDSVDGSSKKTAGAAGGGKADDAGDDAETEDGGNDDEEAEAGGAGDDEEEEEEEPEDVWASSSLQIAPALFADDCPCLHFPFRSAGIPCDS